MWVNLAAAEVPRHAEFRDEVESKLTKDMLMKAQKMSREFQIKNELES
jgi:hypothetical protein